MSPESLERANHLVAVIDKAKQNLRSVNEAIEKKKKYSGFSSFKVSPYEAKNSHSSDFVELYAEAMPMKQEDLLDMYVLKLQKQIDAWQEELEKL